MRITLTALYPHMPGGLWVGFNCALGEGRGRWPGPPPVLASVHEVEISLDDVFECGRNLHAASRQQSGLGWSTEGLRVCGQLLGVDEDGAAALAIGQSIVLLEVRGDPGVCPRWVEIDSSDVALHPLML